ncbi:hypothetical protein PsorP6_018954 [Peronosclerospora sorghi]|nr:hypothetical protein PsorP6_018954 [Peronosclerospora sorghi]
MLFDDQQNASYPIVPLTKGIAEGRRTVFKCYIEIRDYIYSCRPKPKPSSTSRRFKPRYGNAFEPTYLKKTTVMALKVQHWELKMLNI